MSLIGIADVRILPAVLSFSYGTKGWGVMHDEPVLMHCFPCTAHCQAVPYFEVTAAGGNGDSVQFCAHVHQAVIFLFFSCHLHADDVQQGWLVTIRS